LGALRTEHLVRASLRGDQEALETYHDRIRDSVVSGLSAERIAGLHLKIARALEASGRADAEALALHYSAGGQRELAAKFAEAAAEVLELKRRAAEQLLRSGHVDEGKAALEAVLPEVQMRLAKTPMRALIALGARRAWLWLRGTGFTRRDESQLSAEQLSRID